MKIIKDIVKGHFNEMMNNEEVLSKTRLQVCYTCPLFKRSELGPICNYSLFLDVQTNVAHTKDAPGLIRGCGCRLNAKTRLVDGQCPANKW